MGGDFTAAELTDLNPTVALFLAAPHFYGEEPIATCVKEPR